MHTFKDFYVTENFENFLELNQALGLNQIFWISLL